MNDRIARHGSSDIFRPLITPPSVWPDHPLFRGAPDITHRQAEIDAARDVTVRSNDERIRAIFQARPHWPAYNLWVNDRLGAGEPVTVFGPLEAPAEPTDILPNAPLTSLRRVAMENGIKPKRSKVQIAQQLRQAAMASALDDLEQEAYERWTRYEKTPWELTLFEVIDHTIQMIQYSARDETLYKAAQIRTLVWLSRGGKDTCGSCRDAEGIVVSVGTPFQVLTSGGFKEKMDAAKFAFAVAISRGATAAPVAGAETSWNVGSFDEDGDLKALVSNLFADSGTPYRTIEALVNAGFAMLASEIQSEPGLRVEDIMKRELARPQP